ncbi:MAG: cyclic nucleotide-binding domain-containing protein [Candidatus Cloacimonetes bacterium]|nr:cyclic nucleotide-binding domain-containing protein [Candidatus Cloacimonadota bacterium]
MEKIELSKGGVIVNTHIGPIQYGCPPETIKDSMGLDCGVPQVFLLGDNLFDAHSGTCLAELEFPAYFNFFVKSQKTTVICTPEQKERILIIFETAVFGPKNLATLDDVNLKDLLGEARFFRGKPFGSDDLMQWQDFLDFVFVEDEINFRGVTIKMSHDKIQFTESSQKIIIDSQIQIDPQEILDEIPTVPFVPPTFGVTIIGSGHGFDKASKTCGFIIWANQRGILVDPPVDTTHWLKYMGINPALLNSILLTHCHADHDSGTLQKILEGRRIELFTTETVYEAFVAKGCAMSNMSRSAFEELFDISMVKVGQPTFINGMEFRFRYSLHSVPTIGFEVFHAMKSFIYTSDHLNDSEIVSQLFNGGFISEARKNELNYFPWHHKLIFHEAGVPPLHTPLATLEKLPLKIKKRMRLLHVSESQLDESSPLQIAKPGLENTIILREKPREKDKNVMYLETVARVDIFKDFKIKKAAEFLSMCEVIEFKCGEKIIKEGSDNKDFYIIAQGEAVVEVHSQNFSKSYGPSDYIGETAIILNIPRTADVIAKTDVTCLGLGEYEFLYFIRDSDLAKTLTNLYEIRESESWQLLDLNPLFKELLANQKTYLQTIMERVAFKSGDKVIESGAPLKGAYLISKGNLKGRSRSYSIGDFVIDGPALFEGTKCRDTIVASDDVAAFFVPANLLLEFLKDNPGFGLRFTIDVNGGI